MDMILECAENYSLLLTCSYRFIVSKNRKTQEIKLNFAESDFFHLAGFQYLTDISIPRNRKNTLKYIFDGKITDIFLQKSRFFQSSQSNKNIRSRIEELRFLEKYLDTDNIIRIYSTRNIRHLYSMIDAEYMIESRLQGNTVYIFLKKRKEDEEHFCIVSFFKKENVTYGGDLLYWMLKEKITASETILLYRNKNFQNT